MKSKPSGKRLKFLRKRTKNLEKKLQIYNGDYMSKTNYEHPFSQVEKFLVAFDQTVDTDNDKQRVLYAKLVSEEFAEFLQAYFEKDNEEQLDAVCDLIWVLVGYAKSRGWDVEGAFDEVARSNMSKLDPATGKPIKREDGKVMKGENYFRPELEKYL